MKKSSREASEKSSLSRQSKKVLTKKTPAYSYTQAGVLL
jgi:hypothetical protein